MRVNGKGSNEYIMSFQKHQNKFCNFIGELGGFGVTSRNCKKMSLEWKKCCNFCDRQS